MANRVIENGFLLFHCKITPSQIKREEYIDILMCFKCYKIENHTTKDCPTPDIVVCSECTGDHDYRNCPSLTKKCINCKGPHRTMAMSCPAKKEAIKGKKAREELEKRKKEESTYANIVQSTIKKVDQNKTTNAFQEALMASGTRAFIMVIDAHMHNIMEPGTYSSHLNKTLTNNGIVPIKMDDNPESLKLFRNENIAATMNALREIQREAKKDGKKRSQKSTSTDDSGDDEGKIDITIDEDTIEDDIIDRHMVRIEKEETTAEACNIEIIIIKGAIEPKDLKPQEVKQLFKEHKLKYRIKETD
ncbi:hypothetical protein NGRA_3295 [Nosema granulosis]|uniref:Uncharacterized protein n=1 Tax=Nosema granulosis TaxID=83296 RepID=A0A9P6KXT8_9MICR|nr:hypothetical protein NGRA_3295 [Nosema granulosis]